MNDYIVEPNDENLERLQRFNGGEAQRQQFVITTIDQSPHNSEGSLNNAPWADRQ